LLCSIFVFTFMAFGHVLVSPDFYSFAQHFSYKGFKIDRR
jgi:hypothetical protein